MKKERVEEVFNDIIEYQDESKKGVIRPAALLLDSSLITQTNRLKYNIKFIRCGYYLQLYCTNLKTKKDNNLEIIDFDEDYLFKNKRLLEETKQKEKLSKVGEVEYKNLLRSRFQMERLIKTNEKEFKTFITLTFAENIKSITLANKKFNIWRTYIKRIKKDFKYVCVPEYQKRGAVHYHLLTNLDIHKDPNIIIPQKNDNGKILKNRYDVKGWSYGFARVDKLADINIISYLSKYMTKESDNRLYGHRKYLNSANLKQPEVGYLNLNDIKDFEIFQKITNRKEVQYQNEYLDYFGDEVKFMEFRSQHNMYYTKSSYIQFII